MSAIAECHKYMIADMELKRNAMEKVGSAGNSSYKYKPSADIMNLNISLSFIRTNTQFHPTNAQ